MKTIQLACKSEPGSTLLVALMSSAILGITLASYLVMTPAQNTSVARSPAWNGALAEAEAGSEDGLVLINEHSRNFDQLPILIITASSDNWTVLTNSQNYVQRHLDSDNRSTDAYAGFINNANSSGPILTAIGHAQWQGFYPDFRY